MPFGPELLYHQHQIVAVNKPVGLLSQATQTESTTVISATLAMMAERKMAQRTLLLVHRLDRDTSGIMLVATSKVRAAYLAGEFRARRVNKTYLALCRGVSERREFIEQAPLGRFDPHMGKVRVDHQSGRPAQTAVRVLGENLAEGISLVLCQPTTGRTHQIRVHLAINGLPLLGDQLYGGLGDGAIGVGSEGGPEHHLLHAHSLRFRPAPGQAELYLRASLPEVFVTRMARAGLADAFATWNDQG